MELAQWLTSKSVERMMFLSEETNENLVRIKESLLELKMNWESDIDIKHIRKQYQNEQAHKKGGGTRKRKAGEKTAEIIKDTNKPR